MYRTTDAVQASLKHYIIYRIHNIYTDVNTLRAASSSVVSRLCTSITTIAPRDVLKFLLMSVRTSSTVLKSSCDGGRGEDCVTEQIVF